MKRWKGGGILMVFAIAWIPVTGCARGPDTVSLSSSAFNYSDENIGRILINGKEAGGRLDPVKPGDASGSGIICCVSLERGQKQAEVTVQTVKGTYTAQAQIEQPWTQYANYMTVHVLPKRKIVIEISPDIGMARKDLIDGRLKELGIKAEAQYPAHMMNTGPSTDSN